jgi:hypothetical protein
VRPPGDESLDLREGAVLGLFEHALKRIAKVFVDVAGDLECLQKRDRQAGTSSLVIDLDEDLGASGIGKDLEAIVRIGDVSQRVVVATHQGPPNQHTGGITRRSRPRARSPAAGAG